MFKIILKANLMLVFLLSSIHITFAQSSCNCSNVIGSSATDTTLASNFFMTNDVLNTCFKINGVLVIDKRIKFINCDLYMQPNSRIITGGSNLFLNNTKAIGCGAMWDGIRITDNFDYVEVTNNSLIQDAIVAIGTNTNNYSVHKSATLIKSTIQNCKFGVELNQLCTIVLDSSKILGGSLLNGDFPHSGIRALEPIFGSQLSVSNSSVIEGFSTDCIYIYKGEMNLNVTNSTFSSPVNGNGIDSDKSTGGYFIKNNSFSAFETAIFLDNLKLNSEVSDNTFNTGVGTAIHINSVLSNNCKIENNTIKNIPTGIAVLSPSATAIVNVLNNKVKGASLTGLFLSGTNTNGEINVNDNKIDTSGIGLRISGLNNCKVFNNTFKQYNNGIELRNSNNCNLKWNNLNGVVQNNNEAISIDMSMGNSFSCNTTNNALRGFHSNNTCGNSFLYANQFREHNTGLRVESGSIIGKQVHHWNTWLDSTHYANKGAENLNSDKIFINRSEFTVATALNTAYHPTNSGNGFFFIKPILTPWVIKECLQVAPEDSERNDNLFLMTNGYTTNTPEEKTNGWESKRYVYGELKAHPEYMQQSGDLTSFYTQQANSTLSAFYEVGKALAEERYTDAAQLNGAISTTEIYESNLKTVYQLLSQTTTWTAIQTQGLLNIAQQCPSQGGSAVFLARDLYTYRVDRTAHFDNINCSGVSNRASKENSLESTITLVPNPASDFVHISNLPLEVNVKVEIFNTQGYLFESKSFNTTSSSLDINIQNYSSGIYLVRISNNNHILTTSKLAIIK